MTAGSPESEGVDCHAVSSLLVRYALGHAIEGHDGEVRNDMARDSRGDEGLSSRAPHPVAEASQGRSVIFAIQVAQTFLRVSRWTQDAGGLDRAGEHARATAFWRPRR